MSQSLPRITFQRVSVGIFIFTVALRLLVLINLHNSAYPIEDQGDMRFYNEWAQRILLGKWTDGYAFYGLPGYAFLLAGIYKIIGVAPSFVAILQAILEGFLSFLICSLANLIFKKPTTPSFSAVIGILAGVGYAFYLPAQAFSVVLMPTCLLATVFWLIVWWCLRERRGKIHGLESLGIGLSIGGMAMTVATIFFVIPLVAMALYQKSAQKIRTIPLLLAGVILGCSPAILYNRLVAHDAVSLSAHGGLNFFIGNNAAANGYLKIPDGLRANQAQMLTDSIRVAEKALGAKPGQKIPRSAVSKWWAAQAETYISEHPLNWLKLIGQKILNFWNAYQYDDLSMIQAFGDEGITTQGLRFGLVAALGLAGMLVSLSSDFPKSRWVVAGVLLHIASLLTVFITERYRLAAVPGLLILGAYFIAQLWENMANRCWKCVGAQSATCIATAFFVTLPVPNQGAWALDSYNSGIRLLKMGDLPRATEQLELAWRYAPENGNVNLSLGNLYLEKKDYQSAKTFYRRTLRIDPQNTSAWNNLGFIALEQNMPAIAVSFFRKSLEIDPRNALANYQLAVSYLENKQPQEALQAVQTALQLEPHSDRLLALQSKILSK